MREPDMGEGQFFFKIFTGIMEAKSKPKVKSITL